MAQEQCVLDYLRSSGIGVLVPSLEALPPQQLDLCATARVNAHSVENRAVFEVADFLQATMSEARCSCLLAQA